MAKHYCKQCGGLLRPDKYPRGGTCRWCLNPPPQVDTKRLMREALSEINEKNKAPRGG